MAATTRLFSLRRTIGVSLVLLAMVPALLVAWLLNRATNREVEELAGTVLTQVAALVQASTEDHLRQAHNVLNGLFPERPTPAQAEQARRWLAGAAEFEPMAFALMRQADEPSTLYWANRAGDYLSVEHTAGQTYVGVLKDGGSRRFYLARAPGERGTVLLAEPGVYEPRTRNWYFGAVDAKGRVFSPVQVDPQRQELMVSLSQPVYEPDGGAAGVFGTDLYLRRLAELLRTQRISARGAAFVVDETGMLVASSAGDPLFAEVGGALQRRSPHNSANPTIRGAFIELETLRGVLTADTVTASTDLRRFEQQDGVMLMVQRPFAQLGLRWTLVVAAPEADFTEEIVRARRTVLLLLAAMVMAAVFIAVLLARGFGTRLQRLSLAAERLGRGQIPPVDDSTRIREVRQLSQVLHDSAEQLHRYREQMRRDEQALREANETLEARVAHRTAELAASREEALAAARAKAAFLATMSHEIRTPLNGVVGMSTLLAETPLDAEQRDFLQTIRLSSDQLLAVINDILDFSKIESGKLELETEPFSPRAAIEEACDIAAPYAREKMIELIVDVPVVGVAAVPQAILGDVTRLRQVLINLVNNAVKFTPAGEVGVHARAMVANAETGQMLLEFRVTDTGIGIPAERLAALFDAFTQVDASTTRRYGGTGLGLAICKRLVELMGGRIGVDSAMGKGSTFWFTVEAPLAQMPLAADATSSGALAGCRALVVDDNPTNTRILERQLQGWEMLVASASSAAQALELLARPGEDGSDGLPDLVITDMHMPEMDGLALARAIKADARTQRLPIVLLSSGFMPASEDGARLFEARLLKPVRQLQLFEAVARCVAGESVPLARPVAAPGKHKGVTVLVADDNAVNLRVACAMLLKLGYEAQTASGGQEAVEAVARAMAGGPALDIVLMDVNMPGVDGLDATRQIRAAWGETAPPVIALTAAASPEDRERCIEAGMHDYLTKPLQVATLARMLERWAPVAQAHAVDAPAPEHGEHEATMPAPLASEPDPDYPALMDWSRLEEFRAFDDEQLTITREVIGLFVADLPERMRALQEAFAAADAHALSRAAHALKGSAANIGAAALQQASATLESDTAAGRMEGAQQRLREIARLSDRTRDVLGQWPPRQQ